MSIRAYKCKRETGTDHTFNLRDIDSLEEHFDLYATECGQARYAEISIEGLAELIRVAILDDWTAEQLKKDLKQAELDGEEYLLYELY